MGRPASRDEGARTPAEEVATARSASPGLRPRYDARARHAAVATGGTVSAAIEIFLDGPRSEITVLRDSTAVIDKQRLNYVREQITSIGFTGATGANYATHVIEDFRLTSACP
jgi:hypothetical protein